MVEIKHKDRRKTRREKKIEQRLRSMKEREELETVRIKVRLLYNSGILIEDNMLDGREIKSFMRSPLRLKVLRYLFYIYPQSSYLSEIARGINSDPSNVTGALKGLGRKYIKEDSLISMHLVEVRRMRNNNYYRINEDSLEKINEILRVWNSKRNVSLELV